MGVLSVIIVKQGEKELPGLTDVTLPKRLGPKRATRIRRFFNLSKEDDVRKFGESISLARPLLRDWSAD